MTKSLWNKLLIWLLAQVAGGARQAFAQSGEGGEGTCTERTVGFHCDWRKNIRVGEARRPIFRLFTTGSEGCAALADRAEDDKYEAAMQCAHYGDVQSQRFASLPGYQWVSHVQCFSCPIHIPLFIIMLRLSVTELRTYEYWIFDHISVIWNSHCAWHL